MRAFPGVTASERKRSGKASTGTVVLKTLVAIVAAAFVTVVITIISAPIGDFVSSPFA
jgi:hypothetical protein